MKNIHFDFCISSPLKRARETVEIIIRESGNSTPISTDDRIKEINFGLREGTNLTKDESTVFFSDLRRFPQFLEGESVQRVMMRTKEFLKGLISKKDDKTYLISTHGCALRAMLNFIYDNPEDYWHGHVPYNCCVNFIKVQEGKAELVWDDKVLYDKTLSLTAISSNGSFD